MFVAIVGTRCSGKSTVANFLIRKGFQLVEFEESYQPSTLEPLRVDDLSLSLGSKFGSLACEDSPSVSEQLTSPSLHTVAKGTSSPHRFSSAKGVLDHVTRNWRSNFVTLDLSTREHIEMFARRPFFMLISMDAPLLDRFRRRNSATSIPVPLEDFVREDDAIVFGSHWSRSNRALGSLCAIGAISGITRVDILNSTNSVEAFLSELETMDLLNPVRLRPSWDDYFMTLAFLASMRSNCMKRRVGAILVRENRILATGYNGTPRGVTNCNEGGCHHCNNPTSQSLECVCLHAEENALLEAGRERVGDRAVLYCNTCPCLKCTVKIIQTGVREVVYNLTYKMDDDSAKLFKEAGVDLRRYDPESI